MIKAAAVTRRKNPYVGPRAFRSGEELYGRDRETRELADLLIAERIVLLHAPSGAGKTSLIQASLIPLLAREGFHPTPTLRVKTPPPPGREVHNRYVNSVALDLPSDHATEELGGLCFGEVIEQASDQLGEGFLVLVLDQLEEILLLDPSDVANQTTFFRELGEALAQSNVWALLSIREDYMGGLDRFVRYLPGHLATSYRLDFLELEAARLAIQEPARSRAVTFEDEAAAALVRQLATVKIQLPEGEESEVEAPYVQPFQLQVVCRELWRSVRDAKGRDFDLIALEDVENHADIAAALRGYYADVVAYVANESGADEQAIRTWFGSELITPQGFRSQTSIGPAGGKAGPGEVLRLLESTYLIRSDTRAATTWFELAHDKLIRPILTDNHAWERSHLVPWQLAALAWRDNRDEARLLSPRELLDAPRRLDDPELKPYEREFLQASANAERNRVLITATRVALRYIGAFAVAEFLIIVTLVILLLTR